MAGKAESSASGSAIQLIAPDKNNVGFKLNPNIQNEIKDLHRMMNTKIAIICVAGAFRKGKSFLLNFFLRYLTALVSGKTEKWIDSGAKHGSGFHWKCGSKRDTTGILLWSQPFFIRKSDGEEIAVLLMDTQGTFDHQTTQQDCTTIFAFSTLLSSVQIYNISQNIQETDLQHLRLFVEFAAIAKTTSETNEKVLQHLWFLIRDWQYPSERPYGERGGHEYLSGILACDEEKPAENQQLRRGISKHFEKASCFLMPHPGFAVTDQKFNGEIDRLEPEFVEYMKKFVEAIAAPDRITVKKINGSELTGAKLIDFLEIYYEAFSSGKMPTPKSVFSATAEMVNISAASDAKKLFSDTINDFLDPSKSDAEFKEAVGRALKKATDLFNSKCMESDSSDARRAKKKLQEDLSELENKAALHRQLRSEKLSAEKKTDLLKGEMEGLKQQTLDRQKKMEEMEAKFRKQVEKIKSESISKDEMERKLQEESMKQTLARKEMEMRKEQLNQELAQMRLMSAGSGNMQTWMSYIEFLQMRERMERERQEAATRKNGLCSIQ